MGWGLLEQARPLCTPPPSWARHRCPIQPLSTITRESHFMVKEHFSVCSPPGPEKSAEWVQILSHYKCSSYVLHFTACNFVFLPTALSCSFTLQVWLGVTERAIDGILFPQWKKKKFTTHRKKLSLLFDLSIPFSTQGHCPHWSTNYNTEQ